jgi:hypothetical protein
MPAFSNLFNSSLIAFVDSPNSDSRFLKYDLVSELRKNFKSSLILVLEEMSVSIIRLSSKTTQNYSFHKQVVLYDTINGSEPVFPAYFLAFLVGSAVIRNTNFINTNTFYSGNTGGNFGLESESLFFEFK